MNVQRCMIAVALGLGTYQFGMVQTSAAANFWQSRNCRKACSVNGRCTGKFRNSNWAEFRKMKSDVTEKPPHFIQGY